MASQEVRSSTTKFDMQSNGHRDDLSKSQAVLTSIDVPWHTETGLVRAALASPEVRALVAQDLRDLNFKIPSADEVRDAIRAINSELHQSNK